MEKLVSNLKSLGLEHYSGTIRPQSIRLFFPPPKYAWKKRWFWPFGRGRATEVRYANADERKKAHTNATVSACAELQKLLKKNYLGITMNLLMAVKAYEVGPKREKAAFITMVALDDEGYSQLKALKAELQKQGILPVHPTVQGNSAADDLDPGGWSD